MAGFAASLGAVICAPAIGAGACAITARFVHGDDRKPLSWNGQDGVATGLKIDVVNLVAQAAGICVTHECLPWARALQCVYNDEAEGVLSVSSDERSRLIMYGAIPLIEDDARFFFRRDNPRAAEIASIRSIADMRSFTITDSLASAWSSVNAPSIPLDLVSTQQIAYRKLINRRTDVAIIRGLAVPSLFREIGAESEVAWILAPANPASQFRIGLRRSLPGADRLIAQFDDAARKPEVRDGLSVLMAKYL